MDIFENLENLNVSEECFNDIMNMVEEIIEERDFTSRPEAAKNSIEGRRKASDDATDSYINAVKKDMEDQNVPKTDINYTKVIDGKVNHVYGYDEDDNSHRTYVPASDEVQQAYQKADRANSRLDDANFIAHQTVDNAIRHEEEHKKKVHGN